MKNLHITAANCLDNKYMEDHVMRVEYIPLYPQTQESPSSKGSNSSSSECNSLPEEDDIDYHPPLPGSKKQLEIEVEECKKNIFMYLHI